MSDLSAFPLVTVAIPTFNRVSLLERAIGSALTQDYPNIEIVIADNASTDTTESLCMQYAAANPRLRYFRHPTNLGPVRNFAEALARSSGDIFMWLADDDWLDSSYVRVCAEALLADRTCSLVGGIARYYVGDKFDRVGKIIDLRSHSRVRRVLRYYARVGDNAIFYGLMWRANAAQTPFRNVIGGDWLFVADMAYQGRIRTVQSVCVHRDDGGISADVQRRARALGLSSIDSIFPFYRVATHAFCAIFLYSRIYSKISRPRRLFFACLVFAQVLISKCLVQNMRRIVVRFLHFVMGESNYRLVREKIRRTPL